jgi:hypothetical protein
MNNIRSEKTEGRNNALYHTSWILMLASHDRKQMERHTKGNLTEQKLPPVTRRTTKYDKLYETKWI